MRRDRTTRCAVPCAAMWMAMSLVAVVASGAEALRPVPEMAVPEGIVAGSRSERESLSRETLAAEAVDSAEGWLRRHWAETRSLDLSSIARWDLEETERSKIPPRPPAFASRVIGRDPSTETWFVELRGPKLGAKLPIVERYLTFYAGVRFSPGSEPQIGPIVVTIRREVSE